MPAAVADQRQRRINPVPLEKVRKAVEAGVPLPEAAESFGVDYEALRKRARRDGWMTPAKLDRDIKEAQAKLPPPTPTRPVSHGTLPPMGAEARRQVTAPGPAPCSSISKVWHIHPIFHNLKCTAWHM